MFVLPEKVGKVIARLYEELDAGIGRAFIGMYLYGSVALGDYVEGSSDIDFIAFVRGPMGSRELGALAAAHAKLEEAFPGLEIMGSYVEEGDQPQLIATYYEKELRSDGKGADLNPVTWWILRNRRLRVCGAECSLPPEPTRESLRDYVMNNMNMYWARWIERLTEQWRASREGGAQIPAAELDEAVEWCVLGMLRQYYTLREGGVVGKLGAGSYALEKWPQHAHGLIREAMSIKRGEKVRNDTDQAQRLADLIELLTDILQESRRIYGEGLGR